MYFYKNVGFIEFNLSSFLIWQVGEITTDLGKHQHMHDRDDLQAEQVSRIVINCGKREENSMDSSIISCSRHKQWFLLSIFRLREK